LSKPSASLLEHPQTLAKDAQGGQGSLSGGFHGAQTAHILATPEEKKALWEQLQENDDAILEHHCKMWQEKRGAKVSVATMSRAIIHKLGWSFKKRRWVPPSETKKLEVLGAKA
jgi:hypothetical protein